MQEIKLIEKISGEKREKSSLRILLSLQLLEALENDSVNGAVESSTQVSCVIKTAFGDITLPAHLLLQNKQKVSLRLINNILSINSEKANLAFEVNIPQKRPAQQSINTPHLLSTILEVQHSNLSGHKINTESYLTEILSLIVNELASSNDISLIWHLTQNLSYSLLILPLNLYGEDVLISMYKKNSNDSKVRAYHFEWEHSVTGFARLDTLLYYNTRRLEIVLSSQNALTETVSAEIRDTFKDHIDFIGFTGDITFRDKISQNDTLLSVIAREHCQSKAIDLMA